MQILNGIFDNPDTMQREAWTKGERVGQWPAMVCGEIARTTPPWERDMLEKAWGAYLAPQST